MPATVITTSGNIASLDSRIYADLCAGFFDVDFSPTIYIGSGADNVLGGKLQITNPYNVVVRAFPSVYDVTPASVDGMDTVIPFSIPTQAGNYQYGSYTIELQITDSDGTKYTVSKTVSLCQPNPLDKTKKYGSLGAKLSGICNEGKVYVLVDPEPVYKGITASSFDRDLELDYPTGSGVPFVTTGQPSFSVQLYEGVYKISGTSCAAYDYGDNVIVKIQYKVNYSKPILCSLDYCCVFTGLEALNVKLNSDCSDQEKVATQAKIEKAALLLHTIDYGARCGEDISQYITDLEDTIGQSCSCNFNSPTPIINNNPSTDIVITGCNVNSTQAGLTTVYDIENYSYAVSIPDNGGALTFTVATLNGCVQTQTISFDVSKVYGQIRTLALSTVIESETWAAIVKKALTGLDATCLGLDAGELLALDFKAFMQIIVDKTCSGANCDAVISASSATQQGGNVLLSWTATGAFSIEVFVDGVLLATTLGSVSSYTLLDYADGANHTYELVPKCSNGSYGDAVSGTFGFAGCPTIVAPTVSSNAVTNASCPYDLRGLVSALPPGITAQWHDEDNTLASSLVPNEAAVSDGVYYVFATNGAACFSTSVKVIVTCAVSSSCTAPQTLSVAAIVGGLKVSFASAAYPPPSNSYTVQRKLQSAGDGTYVTLATPTYNVSTGKYEVTDTTAAANTLYTYKAISNCGATTPFVTTDFANITCPTVTLSSTDTTIGYSFVPVGGGVDKYTIELYDSTGTALIHTDTKYLSMVFANPTTGTFSYLTSGTTYKVRVNIFIGTYSVSCAFGSKVTVGNNYTLSPSYNFSIDSVSGTGVPALPPTGISGNVSGVHTAMSGTYNVAVSGTIVTPIMLNAYVDSVLVSSVSVTASGTYALSITATSSQIVLIAIDLP